jgi:invasion protein IalB
MSSPIFRSFLAVLVFTVGAALVGTGPASSRTRAKPATKPAQSDTAGADTKKAGKPSQVASYGDWGVFVAQGEKTKTCYALATPKERVPSGLQRDPAYVFIADRPGENVRDEVSVIMGFPVKEGSTARAEIGGAGFDLVAKGTNAWIKNQAEEPQFVDSLKKGSKLVVKAPSLKGHITADSYSLAGLSQALERVEKECP